jgi:hypothetical protein
MVLDMYRAFGRSNALALLVLVGGILLTAVNVHQLSKLQNDYLSLLRQPSLPDNGQEASAWALRRPKYAVYGKNIDSGYLRHVYAVLERAGYVRTSYNTSDDWQLLWAHDYPFKKIRPVIMAMSKHQRVNKLPGSGFVTNKVNLATSDLPHIPKA